ncbi:gamma-aminobutyric acid receptor subunit alpha-2-like [Ptychodera flava]|uniref:gamma-aminobutyric acid receptor subunit alpha-2-like n=1 Tax=Ptychodera flava TaxID=63121 RepID=UPI00396A0D9D
MLEKASLLLRNPGAFLLLQLIYSYRPGSFVSGSMEGSGDDVEGPSLFDCDETRQNLTRTLDRIMFWSNYDRNLRPATGGPPVQVEADIYALSIGPIVEVNMEYHLDVFFRQRWNDPRLAYDDPFTILSLNTVMLESIWYPDTYFHNGKKSYGHNITTPNRLFRIAPNGDVLYTQRLTIIAECKMNFENYPMDQQICPLFFGSNSFSTDDVVYIWHPDKVELSESTRLSQFFLKDKSTGETVMKSDRIGDRSILYAHFYLQRHIGYFLIQIYVPCILVTMSSWVSFWLNPDATPSRVALGVLTILAITTLGWSIKDTLPKVSYAKSLDWYLALCFTFVLGSLVEFAAVNFFSKSPTIDEANTSTSATAVVEETNDTRALSMSGCKRKLRFGGEYRLTHNNTDMIYEEPIEEESCGDAFIHCLKGNTKYKNFSWSRSCRGVEVYRIDRASRIAFPLAFALLNVLYWVTYLSAGGVNYENDTISALQKEWS